MLSCWHNFLLFGSMKNSAKPDSSLSIVSYVGYPNLVRCKLTACVVSYVLRVSPWLAFRFGNLNNLQFLCENGRVHKFANSFCSPAYMLPEYMQRRKDLATPKDFLRDSLDSKDIKDQLMEPSTPISNSSYSQLWTDYVDKLSRVLCSFLLTPEKGKPHHGQGTTCRTATPVSSVYADLAIRWVVRVLHTVFPSIKACSIENELPSHLRFVYTFLCWIEYILLLKLL